ncbi:MAG TPA: ABC transporter permease [Candidatus Heimdallarchaeota archaeon]|nr:ABC transporter permease [Candidatus Heimdallarchaeota archaeon]
MLRDYLRLSVKNLQHRSVRSWLTILGIVVGVAAVVALIALGQGMQKSVVAQFESIGYDTIIVVPGEDSSGGRGPGRGMMALFGGGAGESIVLEMAAVRALPEVVADGALRTETAFVTSEGMEGQGILYLTGLSETIAEDFSGYFGEFKLAEGRHFEPGDLHVVILGAQAAIDMGVSVGGTVSIEFTDFEVIGILSDTEEEAGLTFPTLNTGLFTPITTVESIFGGEEEVSQVFVEVAEDADAEDVADVVETIFDQQGTPVITITAAEMTKSIQSIISGIQLVLSAIAAISLLVGAIGVMNTMYMSVLERTREIGIMKAIGAKDRQVLSLFLIESSLIGFIGGSLGVLLGVALSGAAGGLLGGMMAMGGDGGQGMTFAASFSPVLIIAALLLSLILGAVAGAIPAYRGSKLQPVKALRYE